MEKIGGWLFFVFYVMGSVFVSTLTIGTKLDLIERVSLVFMWPVLSALWPIPEMILWKVAQ